MRWILFFFMVFAAVVTSHAFGSDVFDVVFKAEHGGDVVFSHEIHTKTALVNDNCKVCHEKLYRTKSTRPVTMAEMEKGKSCGACHGKVAFPLAACGRCHSIRPITFTVPVVGDVNFLHAPHTKTLSCYACHTRLFKTGRNPKVTMAQMEQGKSCGACHRGGKIFPLVQCYRCHLAGDLLMKVQGAGPVTFSHGYHIKTYKCTDCHQKIFPLNYVTPRVSMYEMNAGKSCGACHNDYTAFTTEENCVRCHDM
ncbi:cytochrome c3 family protein [Geomonas sp. Red69]|uniref:Cytochrome c3 family protein n=1 Tax=Geomonas diazotrophica TaxID=2843197 RepID=A0ABX8JGC6_9BACT|nr:MULTISPECIES: cytochrome c3 family protein [Geomonas]MBU5637899.1 cytochrome c3 family protein [Geomonas diazotrophica]QWV96527.1 cytochrome c3 family protein [Geomonas nitrogeniifigens]